MIKSPIYLDNNATTLIDKEVMDVMHKLLAFASNPSSVHQWGKLSASYLQESKESIAKFFHVKPHEITFTSGGTESMNMLILGLYQNQGTILTTSIEHPCVDQALSHLKEHGASIRYVPITKKGAPTIDAIEAHLDTSCSLMVFSAVYSETGAKIDLTALADLAFRKNIPLIIDGVALLGKELFTIHPGITAMGFSAHKIHGPKGMGLVFIRESAKCRPLLFGGGQQNGLRPGTENIEGIVGFAKAIYLLQDQLPKATLHMAHLKKAFLSYLKAHLDGFHVHGEEPIICNTINIGFEDVDGDALLIQLDRMGILASMGSACSSGALEPSKILIHMGISRKIARSSLRFSFSRMTTEEEVLRAAEILCELVMKQRSLAFI